MQIDRNGRFETREGAESAAIAAMTDEFPFCVSYRTADKVAYSFLLYTTSPKANYGMRTLAAVGRSELKAHSK